MTEDEKTEFLRRLCIGKSKGGHLELWGKHYLHQERISGIVTDDPHGRFEDGEVITTSLMVKMHDIKGVKILETVSSYYTLGGEGTYDDREYYKESGDYDRSSRGGVDYE